MARLPTVASLFDSGVSVFGKEWKHLSSAVVLLSLPLYLISLGMEQNPSLFFAYVILGAIIGPLLTIITTSIVFYRYDLQKTIHSKGLYEYIHNKFFPVLGTGILAGLIFFASMILLVVPLAILGIIYLIAKPALLIAGTALTPFGLVAGLVLLISAIIIAFGVGVYLMFSFPIVILENKSGLDAIQSSIRLVKGRWWNIFGRVLLLQLIATFIAGIVSVFGVALLGSGSLGTLITALLQQIAVLPITIAMIAFYLDIRSGKKEQEKTPEIVRAKQVSVRKKTTKKKTAVKKTAKKTVKKAAKKTSRTKKK
ncbi:MAG: hypothetical protein KC535_01385 [Nanoarchaeota archaeon]|nr:hypothetical protein [Nanoarchaeota archaeon]